MPRTRGRFCFRRFASIILRPPAPTQCRVVQAARSTDRPTDGGCLRPVPYAIPSSTSRPPRPLAPPPTDRLPRPRPARTTYVADVVRARAVRTQAAAREGPAGRPGVWLWQLLRVTFVARCGAACCVGAAVDDRGGGDGAWRTRPGSSGVGRLGLRGLTGTPAPVRPCCFVAFFFFLYR